MASSEATSSGYDNPCLTASLEKLYLHQKTADIHFTFTVNGVRHQVPAHKAILAIMSDPIGAMFYGELSEGDSVEIVDVTMDAFMEFLRFFYFAKVELTMKNIGDVVKLCNKYLLESAPAICERFLIDSLAIENVCFAYGLAMVYEFSDLKSKCDQMITLNTTDIFETADFNGCDRSVLGEILAIETLSCTETELFDACMGWVKSKANIELKITRTMIDEHLGNLFHDIRFGSMTLEDFSAISSTDVIDGDLFSGTELKGILQAIASTGLDLRKRPRQRPWNAENIVECRRDTANGGTSTFYFQDIESLTFSSNKFVLLGEIRCSQMYFKADDAVLSAELLIIESPIGMGNARIILQQKITLMPYDHIVDTTQIIPLERAVLVKPQFKYEIQFKQCPGCSYFYATKPLAECQLPDTDVVIQFQNIDLHRGVGSLISTLHFNLV